MPNQLWTGLKQAWQNRKINSQAVSQLREDLKKALEAPGCVVFTSRLERSGNDEPDKLIHTFYYGKGYKYEDLPISLKAYQERVRSFLEKNGAKSIWEEVSAHKIENYKVADNVGEKAIAEHKKNFEVEEGQFEESK